MLCAGTNVGKYFHLRVAATMTILYTQHISKPSDRLGKFTRRLPYHIKSEDAILKLRIILHLYHSV
jgi:hypothetical protein